MRWRDDSIGYDYLHVAADDPAALPKIERLARVGRASRTLRGARLGLVGERPAGFDTCEYDAADLAAIFGTEVVPFALDRLLDDAAHVPAEQRVHFVERASAIAGNLSDLDVDGVYGTAGVYVALTCRRRPTPS